MKFVRILDNDIVDSDDGVCTSLWFGGCDIRCPGCHNSILWNWQPTKDNDEVVEELYKSLTNGPYTKSLSILGGEPLTKENRIDCLYIVKKIKEKLPDLFIRVWTGHIYEDLLKENDPTINELFSIINTLIDGPYIEEGNLLGTLKLRGSTNQRIISLSH